MMDFGTGLQTQIFSNKRVVVEGCDSVVDFDDTQILLKSGRLKFAIEGRDLKIILLADNACVVEGVIEAVRFSYI